MPQYYIMMHIFYCTIIIDDEVARKSDRELPDQFRPWATGPEKKSVTKPSYAV